MPQSDTTILLAEHDDGLLNLTLNRPQRANALNLDLTEAMIEAIVGARDIRLCVIRGAGNHFCSGFDLSDLQDLSDGDLLWRFLRIEMLLQAVHHAPFATLALGHGQVIGAGADLFAACSRRVAATDMKLKMPGWNFELALGTRRLTQLIGQDAARDLLIDSRILAAEECLARGLATDLADKAEWLDLVAGFKQRVGVLSPRALGDLLQLTVRDGRNDDLAAIVRTAGRPGLKARIEAYRERIAATRKAAKSSASA